MQNSIHHIKPVSEAAIKSSLLFTYSMFFATFSKKPGSWVALEPGVAELLEDLSR